MEFYEIVVADAQNAERSLRLASPTDVKTADTAAPLMKRDESILSIHEAPDDGLQSGWAAPKDPG